MTRPESESTLSPDAGHSRAVMLGIVAAVTYSITNLALRQLSNSAGGLNWDLWISATKAMPTAFVAAILLIRRRMAGQPALPEWSLTGRMILAGLLMQFGGNLGFQLALRAIGLAITVPILFASLLCSGALAGRMLLGDQVTRRTGISMTLMIVSIVFLSAAAQSSNGARTPLFSNSSVNITMGVLIALLSGLSYGLCGVIIRRVVRGSMPVEQTLFLFSMTGVIALGPISAMQLGLPFLGNIPLSDWLLILTSGVFNAIGFFAITQSYRVLTISRANIINASQNAMCALGAVVCFSETLNWAAIAGIGLSIVGLIILDRR
ncbi:MAG: DMT family transporter [Planctomyces sp.]|jgi:DME family drug/metabolite transporter